MKAKPKGPKYRNLFAREGMIYYQRVVGGRRIRLSAATADWEVAASFRDLYEQRKGIGRLPVPMLEAPRFGEFAARYLEEDTAHLAWTTQLDRVSHLRADGPLLAFFGQRRIDEIAPAHLREWWGVEVQRRGLSTKTGRAYLDVLAAVLAYARDLGLLESSPVGDFREMLRRRSRTKQGRASGEAGLHVRPIESPAEIARLIASAQDEGAASAALVLLCLDAGLRLGEALGLRWGSIVWGVDEDDTGRALVIDENRPRGGSPSAPKSGRGRRVALSRRLRRGLLDLYRGRFAPSPEAVVLERVEPNNFRHREWRRICRRAEIGHRQIKDLRDTFASQLVTAGVPLPYVSRQLGHADLAITARHYARWAGGESYRAPLRVESGEVPADLLARLVESPQSHPTRAESRNTKPPERVGVPGA